MCEQFKLHAGLVPAHLPKAVRERSVFVMISSCPMVLWMGCALGTDCVVKAILQWDRVLGLVGHVRCAWLPSPAVPTCVLPRPMWESGARSGEVPIPQPAANTGP